MVDRSAEAVWNGNLMEGKGILNAESGIFKQTPYSFKTRFQDTIGTNPEELIAAAHAGCFTMAFSGQLSKEGFVADEIKTKATVSLEKAGEGFSIPAIHLKMQARIPKIDQETFEKLATQAKENCPVSKLLNAKITLDMKLEG